jgi:hypothetical protein
VKQVAILIIGYVVLHGFLLAFGVVIGLTLHWLMPSVEFGTAILIGVATTGLSLHFYVRFLKFIDTQMDNKAEPSPDDFPPDYPFGLPRRRKWRPK